MTNKTEAAKIKEGVAELELFRDYFVDVMALAFLRAQHVRANNADIGDALIELNREVMARELEIVQHVAEYLKHGK